jgi:hypothetical protein
MKNIKILLLFVITGILVLTVTWAISDSSPTERERRAQVNTRVDNNGYWVRMAALGLTTLNPEVRVEEAVYTGTKINAASVLSEDSPDVPVSTASAQQSENSIVVDPNNEATALNSNNSGPPGFYGADHLHTLDLGETWGGAISGPGISNSGDPTTAIGTDGRWYVGYITNSSGQGVSYSDDEGENWSPVTIAPNPGSLADKNHMWLDTKNGSPYENYLYNAWTDFGGSYNNQIVVSVSADNGESWSSRVSISNAVSAGSHNQGVNVKTGPNGEVYAVWAIYDGWPQDEKALGFAKSLDGGATWEPAVRIISNIRGIRNSGVVQNMRVNSFPSMAVDISGGSNNGNIYVVWTNVGVPQENTGSDRSVYMIKSGDQGNTWSEPIRVNQSEQDQGYVSYLPWIANDPSNGNISIVFYDNRNSGNTYTEAWCAVSNNAGETWEDFKVSDVSFVPAPISGLATGYMGDYLGITALNGWVYPCWMDNRSGSVKTYVSPFQTIDVIAPWNLQAEMDQETGNCTLTWNHDGGTGFQYFNVYRNGDFVASTTEQSFSETVTEYGYYTYEVTAFYGGENESPASMDQTQYGTSTIEINPLSYSANVYIEDSAIQYIKIKNTGVLDLDFSLSPFLFSKNTANYSDATGGGDEYIHRVTLANLTNSSGSDNYADYSSMYARLKTGESYQLNVEGKNTYTGDQCAVWIDWNQDGNFEESPIELRPDETFTFFSGKIEPPKGSAQGTTRMRVRLFGPDETLSSVGNSEYGEVEDYSVVIASWLSLDPEEGIIAPMDSMMVQVVYDATGLVTGTYQTTANLTTNDINHTLYSVSFTMNVTDLQITAGAQPETICSGENAQLEVVPENGSGSYTYNWTSIPEGFTSNEQNPVVTPAENTTYVVAVDDGVIVLTDTVSVTVNELPVVMLGGDQILCGETEFQLDAGNEGSTYLWSTDETSQTIMASGSGESQFWVQVTNESGCSAADTIMLNFASIPQVDLGADTVICNNATMELDAGNTGAEFLWSTGETSKVITINAEDYEYGLHEFTCEVTNADGCKNSGQITIEIKDCTSIDEFTNTIGIEAYPNPNNGMLNLDLNTNGSKTVSIEIVSVTGKRVYRKDNLNVNGQSSYRIDLSNEANGIYTVFVISDGAISNKKVVLSK